MQSQHKLDSSSWSSSPGMRILKITQKCSPEMSLAGAKTNSGLCVCTQGKAREDAPERTSSGPAEASLPAQSAESQA
jgi:hypothetical protein